MVLDDRCGDEVGCRITCLEAGLMRSRTQARHVVTIPTGAFNIQYSIFKIQDSCHVVAIPTGAVRAQQVWGLVLQLRGWDLLHAPKSGTFLTTRPRRPSSVTLVPPVKIRVRVGIKGSSLMRPVPLKSPPSARKRSVSSCSFNPMESIWPNNVPTTCVGTEVRVSIRSEIV